MNYNRSDIVIVPFPFLVETGVEQKARPALVISNQSIKKRFDDIILAGITSQRIDNLYPTEILISEGDNDFKQSGLIKSSVIRCEYIMTLPPDIITRKIGTLSDKIMNEVDVVLKLRLGLK